MTQQNIATTDTQNFMMAIVVLMSVWNDPQLVLVG